MVRFGFDNKVSIEQLGCTLGIQAVLGEIAQPLVIIPFEEHQVPFQL
jgi:hypothetical protein